MRNMQSQSFLRTSFLRPFGGTLVAAAVLSMTFGACSKEEKKAENQRPAAGTTTNASVPAAAKQVLPVDMTKSLLEVVPKDTVGFFVFEAKNPAYAKYKASP